MPAKPPADVSPLSRAARLVAELSAHDPQYRAAMPLPAVREAVREAARDQVLSRTVATVMAGDDA
uniref:hypothetical protein n=1 Tax=Streptomyces acidiscabies TaxID=42234 RepID=UPI000A4C9996